MSLLTTYVEMKNQWTVHLAQKMALESDMELPDFIDGLIRAEDASRHLHTICENGKSEQVRCKCNAKYCSEDKLLSQIMFDKPNAKVTK